MSEDMLPTIGVTADGDSPTPLAAPASGSAPGSAKAADWDTSPAYIALSARVAKTESTLASLSAQVSQLSSLIHGALLNPDSLAPRPAPGAGGAVPGLGVFSPFDEPAPSPFVPTGGNAPSRAMSPAPPQPGSVPGDANIAALTAQIAALSTSVAQLQRLQQTQANLTRQNSNPAAPSTGNNGPIPPNGPQPGADARGMLHPGQVPLGGRQGYHAEHGAPLNGNGNNGPMNGPNGLQPHGQGHHGGMRPDLAFARPNIGRSVSSSVIGMGGGVVGGDEKWGPPKFGVGGLGGLPPPTGRPGGDWPSPSIGGPVTGGGGAGAGVGANGPGTGGIAAPGAGIVVTKWEHLNLKQELLRSIAKYGIGPPNKIQARVLPFMLKGSDIIAQAPPTQERIISYVVPALQLCLTLPPSPGPYRGPAVIIVTTTVDQATQCHKLVRNVGGPLGVRSALAAGTTGSSGLPNEVANVQRDAVQLLIGTPGKLFEILSRGIGGGECRLLILDEVDQMIARNLHENVLSISKFLPPPRRGGQANANGTLTPGGQAAPFSPGLGAGGLGAVTSPYDAGQFSPFNPASKTPFPAQTPGRFGNGAGNGNGQAGSAQLQNATVDRQTCIFSNTIPTDVINFSQSLNVRDPVRVLVRREGGPNSQESVSSVTPGINLKHTYVYLTITGSARSDGSGGAAADAGPGTIGSGRAATGAGANGQQSEEATRAKEYKLDILVKMLDDYPLWQAIIHVGTMSMLEAVVYKLQSRQWETLYLTADMPPPQRKALLQQWRSSLAGNGPRFLVVFDAIVKPPEVPWAPLVINFDLPRSVEGYAQRAAAAVPPTRANAVQNGGQQSQVNGVVVSFVQAAGGDVEMLRSTECAYRFKSAEIPSVFHDLFQH